MLTAGDGEDLLLPGELAVPDLPLALSNIVAEWTTARPFTERVENLRGDTMGPRDNGETLLLINQSVLDDNHRDQLFGGAGNDWIFGRGGFDEAPDMQAGDIFENLSP